MTKTSITAFHSGPMILLRTLGGLSLEDGPVTDADAAALRKPLAVLAVIARAGTRGVGRDRLLAMFWPESDSEHARVALRQAIHTVRRRVGQRDAIVGGADVRVDPRLIRWDVAEFEAALARIEPDEAVRWYEGPFLDGVFLRDAPEFERWVEEERGRLNRRYAGALGALAERAMSAGHATAAVRWARKLVAAEPLDAGATLALMRALAQTGDVVEALRAAERHENRLRDDFGVDGDDVVRELASRLRAQSAVAPPARHPGDNALGAPKSADPPNSVRAGRRLPQASVRPMAAVLLATTLLATISYQHFASPDMPQPPTVAVLPFETQGDHSAYLARGLEQLLSAALDNRPNVRSAAAFTVASLADQLGGGSNSDPQNAERVAEAASAGYFVLGNAIEVKDSVRVTVSLYRLHSPHRAILTESVGGPPSALFSLVDQLALRLLTVLGGGSNSRLAEVAGRTTSSVTAFKAFLDGEAAMRDRRWPAAHEALERAVAADSMFALAWYRLSESADWLGREPLSLSAIERAWSLSGSLSERDRLLVRAMRCWRRGETDEAESIYHDLVYTNASDAEAWYQLGEVRFHSAPMHGRSALTSREGFEKTLALDPGNVDAKIHLSRLAAKERRLPQLDSLEQQIRAETHVDSDNGPSLFVPLTAQADNARTLIVAAAQRYPDPGLLDFVWRGAVYSENLSVVADAARLLLAPNRGTSAQLTGRMEVAELEWARGRPGAAAATLAGGQGPAGAWVGLEAFGALLPQRRADPEALRELRGRVRRWDSSSVAPTITSANAYDLQHPHYKAYLVGLLSARLGDTAEASKQAMMLENSGRSAEERALLGGLVGEVRAEALASVGQFDKALGVLEASEPTVALTIQNSILGRGPNRHWLHAELLRSLGRSSDALAWYESIGQVSIHEVPYLASAYVRASELREALGDHRAASEWKSRAGKLWAEAEAGEQPIGMRR